MQGKLDLILFLAVLSAYTIWHGAWQLTRRRMLDETRPWEPIKSVSKENNDGWWSISTYGFIGIGIVAGIVAIVFVILLMIDALG